MKWVVCVCGWERGRGLTVDFLEVEGRAGEQNSLEQVPPWLQDSALHLPRITLA